MAYRQARQGTHHYSARAVRASCGSLEKAVRWNGASPYHVHDSHYLGDERCYPSLSEASCFHWSSLLRPSFSAIRALVRAASGVLVQPSVLITWDIPGICAVRKHMRKPALIRIPASRSSEEGTRGTHAIRATALRRVMDELSCLLSCSIGSSALLCRSCHPWLGHLVGTGFGPQRLGKST